MTLSEKTLVPMSFVVILLGGAAWLANIYFESHANALAIQEIQKKQDDYILGQKEIVERLARIEGKLEVYKKWTFRKDE